MVLGAGGRDDEQVDLVGLDARQLERLARRLGRHVGVVLAVLAGRGIDHPVARLDLDALEDVLGQRPDQPLHLLVGDRVARQIRAGADDADRFMRWTILVRSS